MEQSRRAAGHEVGTVGSVAQHRGADAVAMETTGVTVWTDMNTKRLTPRVVLSSKGPTLLRLRWKNWIFLSSLTSGQFNPDVLLQSSKTFKTNMEAT